MRKKISYEEMLCVDRDRVEDIEIKSSCIGNNNLDTTLAVCIRQDDGEV